jgi:hypothetical protein
MSHASSAYTTPSTYDSAAASSFGAADDPRYSGGFGGFGGFSGGGGGARGAQSHRPITYQSPQNIARGNQLMVYNAIANHALNRPEADVSLTGRRQLCHTCRQHALLTLFHPSLCGCGCIQGVSLTELHQQVHLSAEEVRAMVEALSQLHCTSACPRRGEPPLSDFSRTGGICMMCSD